MTGIAAANLSPNEITIASATFLPGFDRTNHNLSDFAVKINGDGAIAHYAGTADHFLDHEIWLVKGTYNTKLKLINCEWLITERKFNFTEQV